MPYTSQSISFRKGDPTLTSALTVASFAEDLLMVSINNERGICQATVHFDGLEVMREVFMDLLAKADEAEMKRLAEERKAE
jgi:hypothetical protein